MQGSSLAIFELHSPAVYGSRTRRARSAADLVAPDRPFLTDPGLVDRLHAGAPVDAVRRKDATSTAGPPDTPTVPPAIPVAPGRTPDAGGRRRSESPVSVMHGSMALVRKPPAGRARGARARPSGGGRSVSGPSTRE
ncbi:hypothetical protein ACIF80_21615 [Streptomyces sp. NPDC085927]|uniref:hypothetical protein n=1 Tax=Streptomyces sp. NPDC085927 TaxID=3365738 RepID=UPI0037D44F70